jgi:hypothetical protein
MNNVILILQCLALLAVIGACTKDQAADNRISPVEKTLFCENTSISVQRIDQTVIMGVFRFQEGYGIVSEGDIFYFDKQSNTSIPVLPEVDGVSKCIELSPSAIYCINEKAVETGLIRIFDTSNYELVIRAKFREIVRIDACRLGLIEEADRNEYVIYEYNTKTRELLRLIPDSNPLSAEPYRQLFVAGDKMWATIVFDNEKIVQIFPEVKSVYFPDMPQIVSSAGMPRLFMVNGTPYFWILRGPYGDEKGEIRVFSINDEKLVEEVFNNRNEHFFEFFSPWIIDDGCNYCGNTYYFTGRDIFETSDIDPIEWRRYNSKSDELYDIYYLDCQELPSGELLFSSQWNIYETGCK